MQLITDKKAHLYMRCDSGLLAKIEARAEREGIPLEDEIEICLLKFVLLRLNTMQLFELLFKPCAPDSRAASGKEDQLCLL